MNERAMAIEGQSIKMLTVADKSMIRLQGPSKSMKKLWKFNENQ